jgi:hypothetical protein
MTTGNEKDNTENAENAPAETPVNPFAPRPRTAEGCSYCEQFGGSLMMPPHFASPSCQSGGRNHCTCGICF